MPRAAPAPPWPADTAVQCGVAAATAAAAGGGGVVCAEPPSRAILRRRRPELASRRTRCRMGRLGAESVGPDRLTDLAGLDRPGQTGRSRPVCSGRAWQYWPGRKGPGRRGARKPAAAASKVMKTPQSREAASQRRNYGQGSPATAQDKSKISPRAPPKRHAG